AETGFGRGSGAVAPRPCGTEAGGRRIELSNGLPRRKRADADSAGQHAAKAITAQKAITLFMSRLLGWSAPALPAKTNHLHPARRLRRRPGPLAANQRHIPRMHAAMFT